MLLNHYRIARFLFRSLNKIINKFGFVISKPDVVHGSPAFSGALVFSRRAFQTYDFFKEIDNVEGSIFEGGIHWGYGF